MSLLTALGCAVVLYLVQPLPVLLLGDARSSPDSSALLPGWGSWVWGLGVLCYASALLVTLQRSTDRPVRRSVAALVACPAAYVLPFVVVYLASAGTSAGLPGWGGDVGVLDGVVLAVVFPFVFSLNGWFAVAVGVWIAFRSTIASDYRPPPRREEEDALLDDLG